MSTGKTPLQPSFVSHFIRVTSSVMTATTISTGVRRAGTFASSANPSTAVVQLFLRNSSNSRTPAKRMSPSTVEFLCQSRIASSFFPCFPTRTVPRFSSSQTSFVISVIEMKKILSINQGTLLSLFLVLFSIEIHDILRDPISSSDESKSKNLVWGKTS